MSALRLVLDHLGECCHGLKAVAPMDLQAVPQHAGKVAQHPLLNVAVLQHIENFMGEHPQHLGVLLIRLAVVPQLRLRVPLCGAAQQGRFREPLACRLTAVVGLAGQVIGIEHVPQLMGKQAADLVIPLLPRLISGDIAVPGIDPDELIVRHSGVAILGRPYRFDLDPPPVSVPAGLGHGHVGEVGGQDAGGEELAVGDGLLLLCNELLDFFMIHSGQE
ncbi:hypothetical protein SDC9_88672 [bioreactor metagenome]|uniref:Uncharacterized protein n=1 Tax=bioreactor metagenome TaxID=1076179 RepID=A0A644ZM55_9ZZZZ